MRFRRCVVCATLSTRRTRRSLARARRWRARALRVKHAGRSRRRLVGRRGRATRARTSRDRSGSVRRWRIVEDAWLVCSDLADEPPRCGDVQSGRSMAPQVARRNCGVPRRRSTIERLIDVAPTPMYSDARHVSPRDFELGQQPRNVGCFSLSGDGPSKGC